MIVCKNCGHQNNDNDTFCGSCGKFLEWTGERISVAQPEPEPPAPPTPQPEPVRHTFMDRVKEAVGIDDVAAPTTPSRPAEPAAPSAPAPAAPVAASSAAPPPAAAPQPAAAAWRPVPISSGPPASSPASASGDREPALAGVGAAAPAADEPMSRRPTSVAPAIARPRTAPRIAAPPTRHRPGDLICGQCGEGNDPARHFCRRCGNTLDEAIAVQLPWYRRLWNRMFHPRTFEAGYRHARVGPPNVLGGFFRILRLAVLALIVVGVLAFALVPSFHNLVVARVTTAVTAVRKLVHPNLDPVYPIGESASSAIAGHPPGLAADGYNNTYWAALPGDRAPFLKMTFASPTDLADIGITPGPSGTAPNDQYRTQPRPHDVHLVFSDGSVQDITLADEAKAQFFPLSAKQVTYVEIHVITVYPTAGPPRSSVAVTEVEFRVKD